MSKTSLAAVTATGILIAAAPAYAQSQPVIALQSANADMQAAFPPSADIPLDFGISMMPGTSPSITTVPGYPYASHSRARPERS